jgi:hypothetical protein
MFMDRMVNLIENICASSKLTNAQKSEAFAEVVYCLLSEGECEGIEHGDSSAAFHEFRGHTEQKTKTIVVMKEMFESAQRLNKLLRNTRIKWDGSDTKPEDIQSLQDELDRRGVVLPSARSEPKPLPANKGSARDGAMRILQAYEKEFAKTPEAREPAPALA